MNTLQKWGGIAALGHAAALVVGMVLGFTLMFPLLDAAPDQVLKFLADNQTLVSLWNLIVYWGSAITLVIMVLALYEQLKAGSPALIQTATLFGFIWAGLIIGTSNLMLHNLGVVANLFGKDPAQRQRHGRHWYAAYGCCYSAWPLCEREGLPGHLATWACFSASRVSSR